MKRWWFKPKKGEPVAATAVETGYFQVKSPESLLAATHRVQLLERIWQYTALSQSRFAQLYLDPIRRYTSFVQQLPASESHHHAYPGGMLDHGLELIACSLKLRQSYLLPSGAAPEDQASQAEAWSAGIAYGALLHDIGKIAVDLHVEYQNGERWHPWHGPLRRVYRFRFAKNRDYKLHGSAAGLIYTQILNPPLLDWLSQHPVLWGQLVSVLADHYEHAGTLGELVLQADRVSTAQNIGANPEKALHAPVHSLQYHLLAGLRHLVKHEFKLNQPGAVGWLTAEYLWLVSKTATDKLRSYLLSQAVDGIPNSNIAMFDELQSHGLVDATPAGKAVWNATVCSHEWQHRFTCLRLKPVLIWDGEDRPPAFTGSVDVLIDEVPPADEVSAAEPVVTPMVTPRPMSASPLAPSEPDYFEPLMNIFEEMSDTENSAPHIETTPVNPDGTVSGERPFIDWLREGIQSHRLLINNTKAKIHTVNGTFFLVSPGIFQRYAVECIPPADGVARGEAWRQVQRQFERMALHRKCANGQNIWTCTVRGPRKTRSLNGYLLRSGASLSEELPADNTFLTLRL